MQPCPEQALWQAVLSLALADALGPGASDIGGTRADLTQHEADRWIRYGSDFYTVCALAGQYRRKQAA